MDIKRGVTLLGLGPGDPRLLTRQAWDLLQNLSEIYLRTRQHPAVAEFPARLQVHSFDPFYEQAGTIERAQAQIVDQVLELGRRPQGVVYAVPGHPFVADAVGPEIARRAGEEGLPIRVVEGLSFLGPVLSALGLDLFPHTALVDALELAAAHVPPFPPNTPAVIAQIHSKTVASEVRDTLMSLYPGGHRVQLVHAPGMPEQQVETLPLQELDRGDYIGGLTALYLPPLGQETSFEAFQEIIARLRAPDGCPWDKEQTHLTLRPYLLEEAYEVLSALDAGDKEKMREEFGDLLLQVVLHAQIASESGEFNMSDILSGIHTKIVSRHPHVFGDLKIQDALGVLRNWERLKEAERAEAGQREASMFDGIAKALPALSQSEEIQRRAARVGFDWPAIQGVIDKVEEEMAEVRAAETPQDRAAEIGDLLFAVVNLARWYGIDAESSLREASARFRSRFSEIERTARQQDRSISEMTLDEMEAIWQSAKRRT